MIYDYKYNIGLYGGCFCPLHLGHLDCIIKASSMCRALYIAISYRNTKDDIDVNEKIRWIYQLTKHMGNVHILTLEDKCKDKSMYYEADWQADCNNIRNQIGEKIDVVFCGSDYDEESFWNKGYPESEIFIFPRSKYNSTAIREDVYGHYDWLPKIVQSYFVKKVLIIGIESVGKSVLSINLANHYNTVYLEEVGKEISMLSGSENYMLPKDFTRILLEHKAKEMKLIEESNKVLIEDTDCLITKFYMNYLDTGEQNANLLLADAISKLNSFDLVLFLAPDVPFVQDGDRSEEIAGEREKYSKQIRMMYDQYASKLHYISGSYEERFEKAVGLIDELFESNSGWKTIIENKSMV